MSTYYHYRYYIDGNKLAILQKQIISVRDPFVETIDDMYLTPCYDDSDGIMVEYIPKLNYPTNEQSTLDVNNALARAIVDFVRMRLAEEEGNERMSQIYERRFYGKLTHEKNQKLGGPRQMMVGGRAGVCR